MSGSKGKGPPGLILLAVLLLVSPPPADPGEPPAPSPGGGRPATGAATPAPAAAAGEVRAIWITRWDYKKEEDVRRVIANCATLGLNRVVFQVRGQADAAYRSSLEPWSEHLEGPTERDGDPGFDPLETAIEEARRHRVELVAWINALPGWKGSQAPLSPKHLVHRHPEWFMMDRAGRRRILGREPYAMLNPCLPAVREHLRAVVAEIAARYPIDGVQIDYIRFPDRSASPIDDAPHDPATLAMFRSATGTAPEKDPAAWDRFRKQAMDRLVSELSAEVRARRPGCRISVAALRDSEHARLRLFQDAAGWIARRWIDEVYPMNYQRESRRFEEAVKPWVASCGGETVAMGIGVHLLDGASALKEQIRILRGAVESERPAGYCLFSYSDFFPSRSPDSQDDRGSQDRRMRMRGLLRSMNPLVLKAK